MRKFTFQFAAVSLIGIILSGVVASVSAGQGPISPGVFIRDNGVIQIDPWVYFQAVASPVIPSASISAPSKVIFGASIEDSVVICRESFAGSECTTLGKLLPRK